MVALTVGHFVGSLARASINRKLPVALTRLAPPELPMREIPIGTCRCTANSFTRKPSAIEAYIQFTPGLITDDGEVTVESTRNFLRDYMAEFHGYITRVYTALPRGDAGTR